MRSTPLPLGQGLRCWLIADPTGPSCLCCKRPVTYRSVEMMQMSECRRTGSWQHRLPVYRSDRQMERLVALVQLCGASAALTNLLDLFKARRTVA